MQCDKKDNCLVRWLVVAMAKLKKPCREQEDRLCRQPWTHDLGPTPLGTRPSEFAGIHQRLSCRHQSSNSKYSKWDTL